jgi:hypothetical protein
VSQSFQNLRKHHSQLANQPNNWLYGMQPFFRYYEFLTQSRNSPHFMEPNGSSWCSQQPTTHPARWIQSTPILFKIHFNIVLPSMLGVPSGFFEGFPHMDWMHLFFALVQATKPANLILHNLIALTSGNHLAHHCAVSCHLLLFPLLVSNIFLSTCLLHDLAYW